MTKKLGSLSHHRLVPAFTVEMVVSCVGVLNSVVWILVWLITWPLSLLLAIIEVLLIPLCVCSTKVKDIVEELDRISKVCFVEDNFASCCTCSKLTIYLFAHLIEIVG